MKVYFKLILSVLLLFSFSCGKKLDPIPKESIVIPAPVNIVLQNQEKGILLKNNGDYTIYVEKSSIDDKNCSDKFRYIVKIPKKGEFLDENVLESHTYTYKVTNIDEIIGLESASQSFSITYSPPIYVKQFSIIPNPDGKVHLMLHFDRQPRFFTINLNGKQLGNFNGDNVTILLDDTESNSITITPFDKFNNKGEVKTITYSNPKTYFLYSPQHISYIYDNGLAMIHWDPIVYAKGYKFYIVESVGRYRDPIDLKVNFVKVPFHGCLEFAISAYNDEVESEKKDFKICE